jgi:hypothetical protein
MGCFLKPSWGDGDKELSKWDEDGQRQDLNLHQPTKWSFLTHSCGQTNPLSHPSSMFPIDD